MIYVTLADGFEEIEALAVVDILRRAELDVVTIGIGGSAVCGSHGISVMADVADTLLTVDDIQAVVLPGGMPGTLHLEQSPVVRQLVERAVARDAYIAAICAAPSILGHWGLLKGRRAVCFPGFEEQLEGAVLCDEQVVQDGRIITARGAGAAMEFGLQLVSELVSPERAASLKAAMQCR